MPNNYKWTVTSIEGPGCPESAEKLFPVQKVFGSSTGNDVWFEHVKYPSVVAQVTADDTQASSWCEATLKYTEFDVRKNPDDLKDTDATKNYRLRANAADHFNVIAKYDIEEGITAQWAISYKADGKDAVR